MAQYKVQMHAIPKVTVEGDAYYEVVFTYPDGSIRVARIEDDGRIDIDYEICKVFARYLQEDRLNECPCVTYNRLSGSKWTVINE